MKQKLLLLIMVSLMLVGCQKEKNVSENVSDSLSINTIQGSYAVDMYNPLEVVGSADYVFLGRVEELVETEYRNAVQMSTPSGMVTLATPYTRYKVSVLENIKGTLTQERPIEVMKFGGLNQDGTSYELPIDDLLPEEGKEYIFIVFAQRDGSNLADGPNSTIPTEESSSAISTYSQEKFPETENIVDIYKQAFKNEISENRERFVSNDEVE